ncbi:winged helix-turn-helix domain-containing protein [uncultured Mameliella sp.]|uniref:winged helix-turn-helix domain-containing protein n=1 Tax=uncultured Mameliella sp. TaxID=1447087 RepID=UPI0026308176|nr:winged helix-turn-helix domain-containing protein [uncultured Mameliella sp.]
MTAQEVIYFDERSRTVRLGGGEPVAIRAKSFAAFMVLSRAYPGQVSKDVLIEEVWGGAAVSDDSITQAISTIRRALGDKDHALLQTNPGTGYCLMVPALPEGASPAAPEPTGAASTSRRTLPLVVAGVLALVLAVGAGTFMLFGRAAAPAPEIQPQGEGPAVAVLGFEVLGGAPDLAVFSRGLQSDIIVALSELDTVSVLAPSVLDTGPDAGQTPLRAYAAHGARFVVGGTVQQSGAGLRISSHLIDTRTSQIVWVRRWDGPREDLQTLQDDVVAALANELANPWSGQITGLGMEVIGDPPENASPETHIQLGGQRFTAFNGPAFTEAERHFRDALEIDSGNAEAWAGLSFVLGGMIPLVQGDEAKALRDARANSGRQAYHLGAGSGRSLLAGSWTAALRGNRTETLRRLREAADKLASDADGLALASIQGALITEDYAEAARWGARALDMKGDAAPDWYYLGPAFAALFRGDTEAARAFLHRAPPGYPPVLALLSGLEAGRGQPDRAVETAARLRMLHNDFTVEGYLDAELFYPESKRETLRALLSSSGVRMR